MNAPTDRSPTGPRRLFVGNDIVHVRDPRCVGKSRDQRFLKRVLHPEERSLVLEADEPDAWLWLCWAAKESAFKVVTKLEGKAPVFVHSEFRVTAETAVGDAVDASFEASGHVAYRDLRLPFRASVSRERTHALSWWSGDSPQDAPEVDVTTGEASVGRTPGALAAGSQSFSVLLGERFSFRERRSIHSAPSAYVRLFARAAIAEELDVDERRLEIVCGPEPTGRVPPRVYIDGVDAPVDLSLSHHGSWVAWAFALQPAGGG